MKKTSVNSIYPNLWASTAGLLQGLTVMQQCVYQMKFRNVCEVVGWGGKLNGHLISICVKNICTKNYQKS